MPHVLVTGGAGYLGSTLCRALLAAGHTVTCYDALRFGAAPVADLRAHPRFRLVEADIRDRAALDAALPGVAAVVHLAAIVGAPAVARDPLEAHSVNVEGSAVVNAARGSRPVILTSTGSVYGAVAGLCTETTPARPLSDYGRQKLQAETGFLEGGNAVVLRLATVYGLSFRQRFDLLPNDFVWKALHEGRIALYERHARRTFLHCADVARAIVHALDHADALAGQIYNVGDERFNLTKLELAERIRRLVPFDLIDGAGADADRRDYAVSYAKFAATGFRAVVEMDDGLAALVRAFRHLERVGNPPVAASQWAS